MATTDAFPAEEYGTGSNRLTPIADAPAWLKLEARGERASLAPGERASLAPAERAFLESEPVYSEPPPSVSLLPPPIVQPSLLRRACALLLFVTIIGAAGAVLVMAVMRWLGHPAWL